MKSYKLTDSSSKVMTKCLRNINWSNFFIMFFLSSGSFLLSVSISLASTRPYLYKRFLFFSTFNATNSFSL